MHLLIYVKIFYAGNKTFCPTSRKNVHLTYWRNRTFDILIINLSQKTSPSGPREWSNVFRIFRPTQSPLCSAILRTMWLRVTLLVLLIPSAIFALFRYSPRATPSCPSLFTGALRGAEGGAGALVNPFIYLFMCHGGSTAPARGCETRLIAGACIEPGIPRERPHRMRGWQKSRRNVRGYSTPSQERASRRSGYTGCLLIRAYFLLKCIRCDFSPYENLNEMWELHFEFFFYSTELEM